MRKFVLIASSLFLISCFFLLSSCDALFIPDPIDPRLPKYTEDGNNVAGAFINGNTWKSQILNNFFYPPSNVPVIESFPAGDSMSIQFFGETNYSIDSWKDEDIKFNLKNIEITTFEQLSELHGKKFPLDGSNSYGIYESHTGGIGQLFLKNVVLNDSLDGVVISGTFGFSVSGENGEEVNVHYGRFDYLMGDEYFRVY